MIQPPEHTLIQPQSYTPEPSFLQFFGGWSTLHHICRLAQKICMHLLCASGFALAGRTKLSSSIVKG